MSPTAAIFQGFFVGFAVAVIFAFGWVWEAVGLLAGAVVAPYLMGRVARKQVDREGPDPVRPDPLKSVRPV